MKTKQNHKKIQSERNQEDNKKGTKRRLGKQEVNEIGQMKDGSFKLNHVDNYINFKCSKYPNQKARKVRLDSKTKTKTKTIEFLVYKKLT